MKNSNSLRRQDRIMKLLAQERRLSINQLADMLDVSSWTIRRDLAQLKDQNLIWRPHGGVELVDTNDVKFYIQSMHRREDQRIMDAKQRIGARASSLLQQGTKIAMGAGTTTLACARQLKEENTKLAVMTNGLNIAVELTGLPHIDLICTGGTAHGDFFTLTGPVAKRAIKSHYFDVAVIGVGGVSLESGLTADSYLNAEVLEAMIHNAQWVIILADHRKLGQTRFANLAELDAVDVLVTDERISDELAEGFRDNNIDVIIADEHRR